MRNFNMLLLAGGTVALVVGAAAQSTAVNQTDRTFMTTVARMDMTGAHEGEMAQTKASRADVKDFARMLVKDDSESFGHLAEVAAKTGVTIPRGIDASKIATVQSLNTASGSQFDRQFTRDQIANDQRALALFQHEAKYGHNSEVKAYASNMIPVFNSDLARAQQCAKAK